MPKGIHFSMDLLLKGANLCFIHLYRFSMGLRSGLLASQSVSNSNPCSSKNFFFAQDVFRLDIVLLKSKPLRIQGIHCWEKMTLEHLLVLEGVDGALDSLMEIPPYTMTPGEYLSLGANSVCFLWQRRRILLAYYWKWNSSEKTVMLQSVS